MADSRNIDITTVEERDWKEKTDGLQRQSLVYLREKGKEKFEKQRKNAM